MVDLSHTYFIDFLTNKRAELADQIFTEDVVHIDVVGAASSLPRRTWQPWRRKEGAGAAGALFHEHAAHLGCLAETACCMLACRGLRAPEG